MKSIPQNAKCVVTFCYMLLSAGTCLADPIDLSIGTAAQSSTLNSFDASLAINGVADFTHTLSVDSNPTWQVQLPTAQTFEEVTLLGRDGHEARRGRLRDITIQIVDFSGDVSTDFTGGTVVYSSPLLNPGNVPPLGSPPILSVTVGGATGNMIRVIRTPEAAQNDNARALSLNEVTATSPTEVLFSFGTETPSITPGDPLELTWEVHPTVTSLTIDNGVGNVFAVHHQWSRQSIALSWTDDFDDLRD